MLPFDLFFPSCFSEKAGRIEEKDVVVENWLLVSRFVKQP